MVGWIDGYLCTMIDRQQGPSKNAKVAQKRCDRIFNNDSDDANWCRSPMPLQGNWCDTAKADNPL
eukprot:scaffold536700_cov15-Prasinocladus_malaysianus.AAC.1